MFENLSKAMRGNQNARKKVGIQAIGATVGGAIAGIGAKAVHVGARINAATFNTVANNTIVPVAKATANVMKAMRVSASVARIVGNSTASKDLDLINKATVKLRNATRKLHEAHAMKPTLLKNAKGSEKLSVVAKKYRVPIIAAGAILGANVEQLKRKQNS